MTSDQFDRARAVRVLLDAHDMGDAAACKAHKISRDALHRYRQRCGNDPELQEAVARSIREAELGWRVERTKALKALLERAVALAQVEDDLSKISQALERLGNMDIAAQTLLANAQPTNGNSASRADAESRGSSGAETDRNDTTDTPEMA